MFYRLALIFIWMLPFGLLFLIYYYIFIFFGILGIVGGFFLLGFFSSIAFLLATIFFMLLRSFFAFIFFYSYIEYEDQNIGDDREVDYERSDQTVQERSKNGLLSQPCFRDLYD